MQALLSSPQPDDPQDAVVAKQYISDIETYRKTAKYWTEAFASPSTNSPEEKVQRTHVGAFSGFSSARANVMFYVRANASSSARGLQCVC